MNRQDVFDYAMEAYGTEPEYPWGDSNAVLRHTNNQKWYALIMEVGLDKLGIQAEGSVDVLTLKCDPVLAATLRAEEGFHPAYHMNKDKWITLRLDGSVADEDVKNLLAQSYELTAAKMPKRVKHGGRKDTEA